VLLRGLVVLAGLVLLLAVPTPAGPQNVAAMRIGVTFSQHEATYRDLAWQQAFQSVLEASPAVVRIAAYWNEIEATHGVYDFATLDWLLAQASLRQQKVILSVGMKAPRWPEYYLPAWLKADLHVAEGAEVSRDPRVRSATLEFVRRVTQHVQAQAAVQAWQVENEPLDAAGPNRWSIDADFLSEEVALVRSVDQHGRPVVINTFVETQPLAQVWGSHDALVRRARTVLSTADVLGLDVYPGRTMRIFGHELSVRWPAWIWSGALSQLRTLAIEQGKDAWIVEGQAEPWTIKGKAPPAAWPGAVVEPSSVVGTLSRFQSLGYTTVLLWGAEHWEDARERNDDAWWDVMTNVFAAGRTPPADSA
jgi:Beta-galactosidase